MSSNLIGGSRIHFDLSFQFSLHCEVVSGTTNFAFTGERSLLPDKSGLAMASLEGFEIPVSPVDKTYISPPSLLAPRENKFSLGEVYKFHFIIFPRKIGGAELFWFFCLKSDSRH